MLRCCCYAQTNPQLWAVNPQSQFDSFLTIGLDGPAMEDGAIGATGIDFSSWSETSPVRTESGAVYTVDPQDGATTMPCILAVLTVPQGTAFSGQVNAQGRAPPPQGQAASSRADDWVARGLSFSQAGGGVAKSIESARATGH